MSILVQKFGGTSVASIDKIRNVGRIITETHDAGHQVVVVVSAMGKSTDALVAMAEEIMPNPSGREYDALLATGEQVTTSVLAMTLNAMGYPAIGLTGGQAGITTESLHNRARILDIDTTAIQTHLADQKIVIITGFQGVDESGNITTLGRGGSDTSAVALAGALQANACHIYTDVDGVYSTDPRTVPEAVRLDRIAYIEMMELARVGANVLHPRAVETARQSKVKLVVRSTFKPEDTGTMVEGIGALELNRRVTGIACDKNQSRLAIEGVPDVPGVAAKVFGRLADENVSVDMIIQSIHRSTTTDGLATNDIAFTVGKTDAKDARKILTEVQEELKARQVLQSDDVAKISIVGVGMIDRPGIASDMFKAFAQSGINIHMIATSEIKISCLVPGPDADKAVQVLHDTFFPDAAPNSKLTSGDIILNEKVGY